MASEGFLAEFPPVPTSDWEQAIRTSLAGPEHAAIPSWVAEEGLVIKPYYRSEDIQQLEFVRAAPGEFPYVRGGTVTGEWQIREEIDSAEPEHANRLALDAVAAGVEEIEFNATEITAQADLALLLAGMKSTSVRFRGLTEQQARIAAVWFHSHPHGGQVSADLNPLKNLEFSAELCNVSPQLRLFTISAEEYEERALGAIEQIAFALSIGVEFIHAMLERRVSIAQATSALGFSFATGPRFFVEIAKLRAFRLAWARVVESFGGQIEDAKAIVYTRSAHWNQTMFDPHVNILRATTETMSAAIGGANSVAVAPFDRCCRNPDQASQRLARNTQLILKREANLARVADPLGGAYLIEAITSSIANKAWTLFQKLETSGGYLQAEANGTLALILSRRGAERDQSVRHRRLVLTGINRFANLSETADLFEEHTVGSNRREAREFEALRLRAKRAASKGRLPSILLAQFGDARMRAARVQFVSEFLACGGMDSEIRACETPQQLSEADADLLVLCSSDPEYLSFAEALIPMLKQRSSRAQVVIAGNPACAEELKRIGVDEFIYAGCDAVEVLERLQRKLGIEG